jgi:hypothetical protein
VQREAAHDLQRPGSVVLAHGDATVVSGLHERFPDAPSSHDTPDLMFVGSDWMVAVEAQKFHDPTRRA